MPSDGCWSSADRLGVCASEPCLGKPVSLVRPFGVSGSGTGAAGRKLTAAPTITKPSKASPVSVSTSMSQEQSSGGNQISTEADQLHPASSSPIAFEKLSVIDIRTGTMYTVGKKREFKLADFPAGYSVVCDASGNPSAVKFSWAQSHHTDDSYPFAIAGNVGFRYTPWRNAPVNNWFVLSVQISKKAQSVSNSVQLKFSS
jgi:hypothetical protein